MKKIKIVTLVAFLGLFFGCACDGGGGNSGGSDKNKMSAIIMDYKKLFNEGINKFKQAECVEELKAIRKIYNDKLDDIEDRMDELTMGEEEKWEKVLRTEFADEYDELMILEKKFSGIYDKRCRELE